MFDGDRLRRLLAVRGMSQSELGRRVGISQASVFRLVKGDAYGSKHLHRIARELGTTPEYLSGETDDPAEGAAPEPELTFEERELIDCVRGLTAGDREALLHLARSLPKHDRVVPPPSPGTALPPASTLAQMFEGLLAQLDPEHPNEHAELLARRLPSALAQLTDLLLAEAPPEDAKPRRRRPTPPAVQPS